MIIVNDIIKLIALSDISDAGNIKKKYKKKENGTFGLLVNKKAQNNQKIHL